jgi:CheY-like chemotaxis protein
MSEGKVIIIQSDPVIVEMLEGPFREAQFEVYAAGQGDEGLALCRRLIPQAVLVDTDLPDSDGYQICKELRATTRTRHAHIVLMARSAKRENRIAALELGVDDFIAIPFDPDEVTLRIRNALRRAAAENLTDPVTGLPSGRLIRKRLHDLLLEDQGWALVGLRLRNLRPYESVHGFVAMQDGLCDIVQTISEAVEQWGGREDFLGHSGGGRFLIVTDTHQASQLVQGLERQIKTKLQTWHSPAEQEQGYMVLVEDGEDRRLPLMNVVIGKVSASDGPFYDIRSLTEALG